MGDILLKKFAVQALTISAPGVIRGRFMGFGLFVEMRIDLFAGEYFSLALLLVEDRVLQGAALVENSDFTLVVLADENLSLAQGVAWALGLDLINDLPELESQVLREYTRLLPGEDPIEFVFGEQERPMGIMAAAGLDSEAAIEIFNILRDKSVGRLDS